MKRSVVDSIFSEPVLWKIWLSKSQIKRDDLNPILTIFTQQFLVQTHEKVINNTYF